MQAELRKRDEGAAREALAIQTKAIHARFEPDNALGVHAVLGKWINGKIALTSAIVPYEVMKRMGDTGETGELAAYLHNCAQDKLVDLIGVISEIFYVIRSADEGDTGRPSEAADRAELILNFVETPHGIWCENFEIIRDDAGVRLVPTKLFDPPMMGKLCQFWPRGGAVH